MDRLALILLTGLSLSGCGAFYLMDDMMDNQFLVKQPVPVLFNGAWTGAVGPFILTFQITSDGNGLSCYSRDSSNTVINKAKIYSNDGSEFGMIQDTGMKSRLVINADKSLTYTSYRRDYPLQPDSAFELASVACKEKLMRAK